MPSLVETGSAVLEKKIRECEKFTDGWRTGNRKVHLKTLSACT